MTDDELVAVIWNLIGGGVDTTTSLTSLALVQLSEQPQLRDALARDPDLMAAACEEYLRWTSINETLTRTCTRDTVLGWAADPAWRIRDDELARRRSRPRGVPRSGRGGRQPLARTHTSPSGWAPTAASGSTWLECMFEVMMREVLTRIPDYVVEHEGTTYYQGNPKLYGVVTMPVTFTPGHPLGVDRPF